MKDERIQKLTRFIKKSGLTQEEAGALLGYRRQELNAVINGRRKMNRMAERHLDTLEGLDTDSIQKMVREAGIE